jgi:hypothetical protein
MICEENERPLLVERKMTRAAVVERLITMDRSKREGDNERKEIYLDKELIPKVMIKILWRNNI